MDSPEPIAVMSPPKSTSTHRLRIHSGAQLALLAALGAVNTLLSLGLSYALNHSHSYAAIGLLLLLLPLWSLWGSSAVSWIRGVRPHPHAEAQPRKRAV